MGKREGGPSPKEAMAFRASPTSHNPNNDFEVSQPPTDGVSSLSFSPRSILLVATSWDNQVRCWDVQQNGQSIPKASHGDGSKIFSGGCDNQAKMWDLHSNQQQQVAAHERAHKKDGLHIRAEHACDRRLG